MSVFVEHFLETLIEFCLIPSVCRLMTKPEKQKMCCFFAILHPNDILMFFICHWIAGSRKPFNAFSMFKRWMLPRGSLMIPWINTISCHLFIFTISDGDEIFKFFSSRQALKRLLALDKLPSVPKRLLIEKKWEIFGSTYAETNVISIKGLTMSM